MNEVGFQRKTTKGLSAVAANVTVTANAGLGQYRTDPNFKSDNGLFAAGAALIFPNAGFSGGYQFVEISATVKATLVAVAGSLTVVGINVRAEAGLSLGLGFRIGKQTQITGPGGSVTVDATPLVN